MPDGGTWGTAKGGGPQDGRPTRPPRPPSFTPFVIAAAVLVVIWAAMEFFLPPTHPAHWKDLFHSEQTSR
ncbi:hypothetical protein J2D73_19870 [Acetobacter sacchari]|uniref:Uncharacterized protein n=1 Tax=Acetobacter sacchari TaxID=2661687 RepID=A0ABS3M1M3_9PROT|nr:hypothetical protein [Acetobacter sacchari]MBO1362043.1 hypothetical protein [Acetobacter sacchari]